MFAHAQGSDDSVVSCGVLWCLERGTAGEDVQTNQGEEGITAECVPDQMCQTGRRRSKYVTSRLGLNVKYGDVLQV